MEKSKGDRKGNLHWTDLVKRKLKNANKYLFNKGVRRSFTDLTAVMNRAPLTFQNFMKHKPQILINLFLKLWTPTKTIYSCDI